RLRRPRPARARDDRAAEAGVSPARPEERESRHPPDASKVELGYQPRPGDSDFPVPRPRVSRARRIARGALTIAVAQFRRNRMARFGALAIACIALAALFAALLASDLPIACRFRGQTYLLPNVTRPAELLAYDNARL